MSVAGIMFDERFRAKKEILMEVLVDDLHLCSMDSISRRETE
jgi:hypothetical protein